MSARWQSWFALGVVRFGLRPSDFWALSLCEWAALVRSLAPPGGQPPERSAIEAMRHAFPDNDGEL